MKRLLTLLVASALAGCAASSRVVKVYEDPTFTGGPFTRILVVGLAADRDARWRFEDAVVRAIGADGTEAIASIMEMSAAASLDADTLLAAARGADADAVLITRLLDQQLRAELGDGRVGSAEAVRRSGGTIADFFRYDYVEHEDPMTLTAVRSVVAESDLYDVEDMSKLLWTVQSSAIDKESVFDVIETLSAEISSQLERDGLTR